MNQTKLNFFHKFILFLNILAITGLCLSYLSGYINPQKFWYISLFGLAYPFILLGNIIFIIYWILFRKKYALISLIAILIGYKPLIRTFGFRFKSDKQSLDDRNSLKLMTWNIHYLRQFGAELDTVTRDGIFKTIKEEQPDILGLQEFFTRKKGKYNVIDSVKSILGTKYYLFNPNINNDFESWGLAVFSKYPIVNTGLIQLDGDPESGNRGMWVEVDKSGKVVRVYILHLASISFQPKDYAFLNQLKSDLDKGKDLTSSKIILWRLKNAFIKRSNQISVLKRKIESDNKPFILMGDFNDTPASYAITQLSNEFNNAFTQKGSGLGVTYNGDFPNFQIDYIMSSPQINFQSYDIIKRKFSDHYPVVATATLP